MKEKWYKKVWFMWVMLVIVPPVGIILLWALHKEIHQKNKIIITAIFCVWFVLIMIIGNLSDNNSTSSSGSAPTATPTSVATNKNTEVDAKLNALVGKNVPEVNVATSEIGYTPSYTYQGVESTEIIAGYDPDEMTKWIIIKLDSVDHDSKSVKYSVTTEEKLAAQKANDALSEKLDPTAACIAISNYGDSAYPYGFKLHYITNLLAEEAVDENTWYIKASCSVTNMYGAKMDATCEANVTGTTENPQVTSFTVY